jgi:predicted nuclease of predicted toxin-antitoxin system
LLFLIDAQLPPALAEALRNAACEAVHVADLGLLTGLINGSGMKRFFVPLR